MPSSRNGGNIKFGIDFEANQASLNKLKKSLQDLQKIKFNESFNGNRQEFNEVKARITEIQNLMKTAFNPTLNTSNITAFKNELEKSGMSLKQIQSDFSRFGSTGDRAFNQLTTSVLTTNLKLKQTNSLIDSMGKTMVNTVKWGVASSVMNTFTQSVQGAFQYVQSLEKSLTNIRIVTGDSTERMAEFAVQANRSAQALGRSTLDYAKASLTYYQQGLNAEDVQARTEATLKAQNITGAGSQMADYLTSVWNGYKVANEEAELYVDKLAAVADSSASDMSQLAIAMSKVASTANTMGVDVDQLNAQIATVVATTRQAPESVGTAFKTIYTRMNDIKAGSDEAEISLGNYSSKMAELGFNVLDATGHLRDTGQVMEEIGGRWKDLTREQQIYLAQTMGGQRQVNQLMALFDNWTTYSELLNTSLESEGTLAEKNSRYMESLGAKMEQLGAAGERVKDALIDSDSMKSVIDALTSVTNLVANLFETMGSGQTILLAFGSTITQLFSGTIAKEINSVITNMQNMKTNAQTIRNQLEMTKMVQQAGKDTPGGTIVADRLADIQKYYSVMDEASINNQKNLIAERGQLQNQIQTIQEEQKTVIDLTNAFKQGQVSKEDFADANNFSPLNTVIGETQEKLQNVRDLFSKNLFENWNNIENIEDAQRLVEAVKAFQAEYEKIDPIKAKQLLNDLNKLNSGQMSGQSFGQKLQEYLTNADTQAKKLADTINNSAQALSNAEGKASSLDKALKQNVDSAKQLFDVTNAVKMISAIGQISSSLMTIKNLGSIWQDEDVSTGEKIAKTFTSLGFIIPSLVSGYTKLTTSGYSLLKNEAIKLATLKLQTKELEKQAVIENFKKTGKGAGAIGKITKEVDEAKQHLDELQNGTISGSALIGEGLTGILGTLGSMLPILLGIGVAVGGIYLAYKAWNKEADAAKKANEVAADTKKTYDELKTSLQDVKSALEDLHSAEDNLDGLTKGTQEWRDALQQCNDKVLELISNYPELAQYVTNENGQLKLSAEGEQAYLDQLQAGVQNARNASYIASSNSREADARAAAADIGHNSRYTYDDEGRQMYASADNVLKVVDAIDKVVNEGASLKDGLAGLKDKIIDETHLSGEVVSSILKNEDALLQLRTQLQQNETADKLMYKTMAQGALANDTTFKGMDQLGQQVASAMGGANLEKRIDDIQKDLIADMSSLNMGRLTSGSDGTVQEILKRLNEAQGTNWKMDSNAVRGGTGDRTLAFLDQAGQLHTYTKQQIASTIAAKEALENLGASAENASKMLANIDTIVSSNAQNAVKQWIAGQNITDINKTGLQELPKDLSKLFDEDQLKSLAEARGIDTQKNKDWQNQLQQDWENSLQDLSSSFDNVTKDTSRSVREAFNNIKDDNTIKQATLGAQQEIIAQMQQAFNKGGSKALSQLTDFYSKLKDTDSKDGLSALDAFSKATKDFDFNTGSVEDFKNALKEAGVETNASTQAIQAYINAQKQASELSPEQNYKSVHDITDNLKRNDTIDAEQAATLEAAGVNLKAFFTLTADGSYKLKVNAETFQQYINGITIQPFKAKMDQLQNKIDSIHSFGEGGQFEKYSSQNMGIDEFSNTAGTITNITGTDAQVVTGQDTEKLQAQIEFLKMIGEEDAAIRQAEVAINEGRTLGATDLQRISELVGQHSEQYQNLSELEKQYLQDMLDTQQQIADASDRGLDEDVDEEKWENLSEHLQKYADQIPEVSDELKDNADAADNLAQAMLRYDSAIGQVKDNYDDWLKALSSDSIEDQIEATEDLENVYSDLLDLPFENILSQDFLQNVDNLNLLKQAANGSEQAYDELLQKAQQDIQGKVSLDNTQFWDAKNEVTNAMDEMNFQDIQIGADLDTGNFISQLQNMVNAASMSAEQATDYLASMGIDAEVEEIDSSDTEKKQSTGYTANLIPHTQYGTFPAYPEGAVAPTQVDTTYTTYSQEVSPQTQVSEDLKENKAFTLKVKSAHKSSGGGFKYKNSSAGNKGGSGKKGGGGKGGKGGSGKAKEPNKAKPATSKPDRYRNNTVKANNLANSMTKLQKAQERLTGKDALDNLQKQLQILQKQNRTINERIRLQKDEQAELKNALKKYGAAFNEEGTLTNYNATYSKIIDEYNKVITKWNSMSADQQEKNKDMVNNAKEIMDKALDNLKRYDALQQEQAKSIQDRIDNAQAQIDNKVKQFELKIEASLDLSQAKRDWNKFRRDFIEEIRDDDILGLNRYKLADLNSFFNKAQTGSLQVLSDKLHNIMGAPQNSGIFSADYLSSTLKQMSLTDSQAWLKQITDVSDNMVEELENLKSVADEVKESIFDMIDSVGEAFDEQMNEYEFLGDVLDHNIKLIELMYGDKAYDKMSKYYDSIAENNNKQLDFLSQTRDMWYGRMMEQEYRMNQLAAEQGTNSIAYKEAEERFKRYQKEWIDSVKNLNGALEDALQNLQARFQNTINNILVGFEKELSGGRLFDDIADEWDMLNDKAETYLDTINAAYEVDKLENAFQDAINGVDGDLAAQQSLTDLMEQQVNYLRDKEKLTQYDVDRANALLQIEVKRLALEQARSNKNRLRLRRDSQGNYTYQYTADSQSINKAQQELADAQNSLYNLNKNAYNDNLNSIQKSSEDLKQRLEDIWTDTNLSDEERLKKSYELEKYYGAKINDLLKENATIRQNLMESAFKELAKQRGISEEEIRAMSKEQQDALFKELVPQSDSYLAQMVDNMMGEGGFSGFFDKLIEQFRAAAAQNRKQQEELEKNAKVNFEDITENTDILVDQIEKLLEPNKELVDLQKNQLQETQAQINYLNAELAYWSAIVDKVKDLVSTVSYLRQGQDLQLLGFNQATDRKAAQAESTAIKKATKEGNSASDLDKNYKPYVPEWTGSDWTAMFGSFTGDEMDVYRQNAKTTAAEYADSETTKQAVNNYAFPNVITDMGNVFDSINSNVLSINDTLNSLISQNKDYQAAMLTQIKATEEAITNQVINVNADFPNAKDVTSIIRAIEDLPLAFAQSMGKKTEAMKGHGSKKK